VERSATHRHAWGAQVGCFAYRFDVPAGQWRIAQLRARLSSDRVPDHPVLIHIAADRYQALVWRFYDDGGHVSWW